MKKEIEYTWCFKKISHLTKKKKNITSHLPVKMKANKRTINVEPKASHELHVQPIPIGKSKES